MKHLKTLTAICSFALFAAATSTSFAQELPVASYVKETGKLPIAMTIYAPFSYLDAAGKQTGLSVELARVAGKYLGAEPEITLVPFTTLIPSLAAGRIKIAWLNASVTEERLKQADFVSWMTDGSIVATTPENKERFSQRMALCGRTIAVQSGSLADFSADTLNRECQATGKAAVKKDIYPSQQDSVQAVITGRADAYIDDATSATYYSQVSNGKLVPTGEFIQTKPIGHIIAKGDTATAKMLAAVLQKMMDDGTYAELLKKYGMSKSAIAKPVIYTDAAQLLTSK